MKLYIKQKVWSWRDKFTVLDELGDDRYTVEGEFFSLGRKLHVYDKTGSEVVFIEQELMSWMPRYNVYVQGQKAVQIARKFTWFRPKYEIIGQDWTVEGDWSGHDYEVSSLTRGPVVTISKEWMTWGDSYELNIADPNDELLALAVVLTIDCVLASNDS